MSGNSALYIEQMYQRWTNDRNAVHASWDAYFSNLSSGASPEEAFSQVPDRPVIIGGINSTQIDKANYSNVLRLFLLIRSFRNRGHAVADLDPLSTP